MISPPAKFGAIQPYAPTLCSQRCHTQDLTSCYIQQHVPVLCSLYSAAATHRIQPPSTFIHVLQLSVLLMAQDLELQRRHKVSMCADSTHCPCALKTLGGYTSGYNVDVRRILWGLLAESHLGDLKLLIKGFVSQR